MLVERSSSDETSAAADVDAGALIESADGCDEPRDSNSIGAVSVAPDDTGSPPAMLDVIPVSLVFIVIEFPWLALPLTSPSAGMSAAELEVVPASEPCPAVEFEPLVSLLGYSVDSVWARPMLVARSSSDKAVADSVRLRPNASSVVS
jgi:hypothetical protein